MNALLTFVLCCLSLLVITQNEVVATQRTSVVYTPSSSEYKDWFPVPDSGIFKFKVRAQAFTINLNTYPVNEYPKFEIGICHPHSTSFGIIWKGDTELVSIDIDKKYYASETKFVGYWVTWFNNNIAIGLEGETTPFLSYDDPKAFPISFIGIHTVYSGNPGIWIVENN